MQLEISGESALVPRTIFCIGRNYAEHVREMGDVSSLPTEPVVFLKPASALVPSGAAIVLPKGIGEVHHEVEIVLVIGKTAKRVRREEALDYLAGYALGIDVTARDLQRKAKDNGLPWSVAKGYDMFAPLGPITAAAHIPDPANLEITLEINGERRQHGNTRDLIFDFSFIIEYLSGIFTLQPGDLIYTGTPEGVGPLHPGDKLTASAGGVLDPLYVSVKAGI